jgi:hypothetical protein
MTKSPSIVKKNTEWNEEIEKVLRIIQRQCNNYKLTHNDIATKSEKTHSIIMITSIVVAPLSGIVSSMGTVLYKDFNALFYFNVGSTILSFLAGILVSVTKFSKFDKMSQAHSIAVARYTSLEENIKRQLILKSKDRINAQEYLDWVIKNFDDLYTSSPMLTNDELNKYKNFEDIYSNTYDIEILFSKDSTIQVKEQNSHNSYKCKNKDCDKCNTFKRINLDAIKKDKNQKTYIFSSHQDLKKYDDENMILQIKNSP